MNAIRDFDMGKFLHLGMDGPSTNWNVLDLLNDHQVTNGVLKNIGHWFLFVACSSWCFPNGMIKPGWDIGKILKALYKIIDESPVRHNVYLHKGHQKYFQ